MLPSFRHHLPFDRLRLVQPYVYARWPVFASLFICVVLSLVWGVVLQTLHPATILPDVHANTIFSNLNQHDSDMEAVIVEHGYSPEGLVLATKFPLFAMLTRLYADAAGVATTEALPIASKLGQFVALLGLWALMQDLMGDDDQAGRAVFYLTFSILGAGFVWILSYPEGLFVGMWAWSFVFFFRRRYIPAGCMTVLAVLTRPQAAPTMVPVFGLSLIIGALHERERWPVGDVLQALLLVCIIPSAVFALWLWRVSYLTQVSFAPLAAQVFFGRDKLVFPWQTLAAFFDDLSRGPVTFALLYQLYMVVLVLAGCGLLLWLTWRRQIRWELALFSLLNMVLALSSNQVYGLNRFALVTWISVLPIYIVPRRFDTVFWLLGGAATLMMTAILTFNVNSLVIP